LDCGEKQTTEESWIKADIRSSGKVPVRKVNSSERNGVLAYSGLAALSEIS